MATISLPLGTAPVLRPKRKINLMWVLLFPVRVLTFPFRLMGKLLPRRLSAEEKAELAAQRRLKKALEAKHNQLDREARHYADTISRTLANHGVAAIEKIKGEREVKKYVRWYGKFYANEEQIHLRVDTRPGKLPFGIGLDRLEDVEVLRLLGINCRHRVRTRWAEDGGFWFVIDRKFGVGGLPTHVQFEEVMGLRPANASSLSIPLGCGERKQYPYKELTNDNNNMLVAGTIGSGKSKFLHSMICTLIRHNSPSKLKLVMVDLKGGVEFKRFHKLPHIMKIKWLQKKAKAKSKLSVEDEDEDPGTEDYTSPEAFAQDGFEETANERIAVIDRREEVPNLLAWLIREGDRRLRLLNEASVDSIGKYNQHPPDGSIHSYLPHVFLFIDEWADVKLTPQIGRQAELMLTNISNRFRAAGIHVVVCTQSPNRDVLVQSIRNALPTRMVFKCPDQYMSQALVGDYRATEIDHPGRGFFVSSGKALEVQTPFINDETIVEYVKQSQEGKVVGTQLKGHDVSDEEIVRWAKNENNGNMDWRAVLTKFSERRMTQKDVMQACRRCEGKEFDIDGTLYTVLQGSRNPPIPRRVVPVTQQ
jgi:DNA segregation ATPase FtsK/SpoIIIE-like protein